MCHARHSQGQTPRILQGLLTTSNCGLQGALPDRGAAHRGGRRRQHVHDRFGRAARAGARRAAAGHTACAAAAGGCNIHRQRQGAPLNPNTCVARDVRWSVGVNPRLGRAACVGAAGGCNIHRQGHGESHTIAPMSQETYYCKDIGCSYMLEHDMTNLVLGECDFLTSMNKAIEVQPPTTRTWWCARERRRRSGRAAATWSCSRSLTGAPLAT